MTIDSSGPILFPQGFLWGAATAAYQIEGAAAEDGRGPSIWDVFSHTPGKTRNGETGDRACDHYHRLEEDLDLIAGLVPHYRFSVSWTRILPDGTGVINQKGVDFYNRLIDGLIARGVTPWVTMYHWDLPQALHDKGGWTSRESVAWFDHYAQTLLKLFSDRVKNWIIINEPSTQTFLGYGIGVHAPGLRGEADYAAATHHMNLAIGSAYRLAKAYDRGLNVGSSYVLMPVFAAEDGGDSGSVAILDALWNRNHYDPLFTGTYPEATRAAFAPFILEGDAEKLNTALDFVGIQHYSPAYARRDENGLFGINFGQGPDTFEKTDIGWPIDPPAFHGALMDQVARYGDHRMIITENGIALFDRMEAGKVNDTRRIGYYRQYLAQVHRAIADGARIDGYFVWSLLDNYEWSEGYSMRFGLVYVDYETCIRTAKDSYRWYAQTVRNNGLTQTQKDAA
ncbi:MAG: beta-glucosidase [Micavibrio aeruginosavorus]|nr:beta-glucosidase [Micavibrio aeruginosavorus]